MSLPTDAKERKDVPIATGVIDYFPDALISVAVLSRIGNNQHNPGASLHWDRSKSGDESDALMRHFVERGTMDTDGVRHSTKVAWRALALLQKEIEDERVRTSVTDSLISSGQFQLELERGGPSRGDGVACEASRTWGGTCHGIPCNYGGAR